jgi:sulfide:quinone oxidoreductase
MEQGVDHPMKVVIVGGGVGALELVLALHKLAEERIQATLIAPEREFRYRPTSVAVPFGRGEVPAFPISEVADAAGARLIQGTVSAVDIDARTVLIADDERLEYDALVVACGARRVPALKGGIPFRGEEDIPAIKALLEDVDKGRVSSIVFALPGGASWALPLYELALLTSAHIARHNITGVTLSLVTPEDEPLAQFGGDVSEKVADLLARRGITILTGTYPVGLYGSMLMLAPGRTFPAQHVVCMPEARGIVIDGLPHNFGGFLPTDLYGRVSGAPDVFAIGDITSHPIKQGGVAAQQADVLAQLLAREAGAPLDEPEPHRPSLRGLLLTGEEPQYLDSEPTGGRGAPATISAEPLWWPGGKIAAHHLGAYLAQAYRHTALVDQGQ